VRFGSNWRKGHMGEKMGDLCNLADRKARTASSILTTATNATLRLQSEGAKYDF
jgi:hypothetical protein